MGLISRTTILLGALCGCVVGCARVGLSQPEIVDRPVKTLKDQVPQKDRAVAEISQDDTLVTIEAKRLCKVRERRVVERTTTYKKVNHHPAVDWTFGTIGLVSTGIGVGFIIDANQVHPDDASSREYNPTGPTNANLLGAGILAGGAIFGVIALVDAFRGIGEETEMSRVTLDPKVIKQGVICRVAPLADAEVHARIAVREDDVRHLTLGKTDKHGVLELELEELIPKDLILTKSSSSVDFVIHDVKVGTVKLGKLYERRERRAWKSLQVDDCREPQSASSCEALMQYLVRYPKGRHASDAKGILHEAEPKLRPLLDAAAWAKAKETIASCASKKDFHDWETPAAHCHELEKYISNYPKGAHVAEAKRAINKGRKNAKAIAAKRAAAQQKADKEDERARKAEAARVAAIARAKARKAAAAARAKKQCPIQCATTCGGYGNVRCHATCVELKCDRSGDPPKKKACVNNCVGYCGGFRKYRCCALCVGLECDHSAVDGKPKVRACVRKCATKCKGHANTRCLGRCVVYECNVDPRAW